MECSRFTLKSTSTAGPSWFLIEKAVAGSKEDDQVVLAGPNVWPEQFQHWETTVEMKPCESLLPLFAQEEEGSEVCHRQVCALKSVRNERSALFTSQRLQKPASNSI
jgi:hypothetical protein